MRTVYKKTDIFTFTLFPVLYSFQQSQQSSVLSPCHVLGIDAGSSYIAYLRDPSTTSTVTAETFTGHIGFQPKKVELRACVARENLLE